MNQVAVELGNFLTDVQPWLTPAALLAILTLLARHYAAVRRANTADKALVLQADTEALKAYSDEVKSLRRELREIREAHNNEVSSIKEQHRNDLKEMERRNTECDEDREQLRDRVEALRDYADGLYRVILQNSAVGALALGDFPSEDIRKAAERVDQLFKRSEENGNSSR